MSKELVLPPNIRIAAKPGESVQQSFVVPSLPSGNLTAHVIGDSSVFRLNELIAYEMVRYRLSDDEFEQLPPSLQDEDHRFYVVFEEVARAGAGTPLPVWPGLHVEGIISFYPPVWAPPSSFSATLAIDGLRPTRVEIPLLLVVGDIKVEFPSGPVVIHQNQWTPIPVRITLPGAPDTDLTLAVTHGYLNVPPTRVRVPTGRSVVATLNMHVTDNAPVGSLATSFTITGHSQKWNFVPFTAQIKPPLPPPPTFDQPLVIRKIHGEYLRAGGPAGRLGYPTSKVQFNGDTAVRFYRGGRVEAKLSDAKIGVVTQAYVTHKAVVTLLGFKCVRESSRDGGSDQDEPYFVVSIDNGRGSPIVQKFGPFPKTNENTVSGSGALMIIDNLTPNPMSILVAAYEYDHGDPDETAKKLQEKLVELSKSGQSAAAAAMADAADGPGIGPTAVAGAIGAVFAGPWGALLTGAIVEVFGLGDDFIGQGSQTLFARPELVGKEPDKLGSFMGQDYNVIIDIDGGEEGHYQLYFDVDGRTITET